MINKKQRPVLLDQIRDEKSLIEDNEYTKFTPREQEILELLFEWKMTLVELAVNLNMTEPRVYIRKLRKKGVPISNEWIISRGIRCKRYWIKSVKTYMI